MEEAVENIRKEFVAKTEAVAFAESGGHIGTHDDFAVGEGKDIGGRRVAEMAIVKPTAFTGGDQDDAELRW